jgi:cytochrome c oxidase cbb3-type subunit 3
MSYTQRMKSKVTVLILCCICATISALILRERLFAQVQSAPSTVVVSVADGPVLFAANCGACHGSDGRSGERAPDIATRREVVSLSDADLIRTVENGVAGRGMPAFGFLGRTKIDAIIHHLRTLQGIGVATVAPGDPHRGERLFFGKAECSSCHMINGHGGFIAADLSGYGPGRSVADIRAAIVDPDRKLDRSAQCVTVVTTDGKIYTGFVRSGDNFSFVLQTGDGAFRLFARSNVMRIEYSGHSSMPRDYATRLSSKELDDLISYLLTTGPTERKISKDDDE